MQETLYEESAKCLNEKSERIKYRVVFILSLISFFFALVSFFILISFMDLNGHWLVNVLFYVVPFILFLTIGLILFKLKNKFCVDYDYIFVTGSIRISKVINNSIRQTIYRLNCSQIEKIGPFGSKLFKRYIENKLIKVKFLSSNNEPDKDKAFYYLLVNIKGEKKLLILECSKTFIIHVLRNSNRTIRDEELKWFI